jgi:hypothetical protein
MRVAEKLDWKGLKIKKSVGNRKIIVSDEVRHRVGKGQYRNGCRPSWFFVFKPFAEYAIKGSDSWETHPANANGISKGKFHNTTGNNGKFP